MDRTLATSQFESYVILTTAKTNNIVVDMLTRFESYVILTTAKTFLVVVFCSNRFESYVILTTAKTKHSKIYYQL